MDAHHGLLTVGLVLLVSHVTVGQAVEDPPALHLFMAGKVRMTVREALAGAARRLGAPRCQRVLSDFSDDRGRLLAVKLATTGRTASEYIRDLYFVDADALVQCRRDEIL